MTKGLAEILKEASEIKGTNNTIKFLQDNTSKQLEDVLSYTYDKRFEWKLPEGDPPYTPSPKESNLQNVLYSELKRIYIFLNCNQSAGVNQIKREAIFIELLESVDPDDAKLLLGMKDRKIPFKGITENLIKKAFPDLSAEWP